MFNLPDQWPEKWHEVLILPVIFTIFALLIWFPGRSAEFKLGAKWKWWAFAPLAVALYAGLSHFMHMQDPVYKQGVAEYGKKMLFAHYGSFFLPLVVVLGLIGLNFWDKKTADRY